VTNLFFYISVLVLAALLFLPASRIVWVMSVRRLERKLQRKLDENEIAGQKQRARFIALFLVLIFSWLFNMQLPGTQG
jgi:dolichol kinase